MSARAGIVKRTAAVRSAPPTPAGFSRTKRPPARYVPPPPPAQLLAAAVPLPARASRFGKDEQAALRLAEARALVRFAEARHQIMQLIAGQQLDPAAAAAALAEIDDAERVQRRRLQAGFVRVGALFFVAGGAVGFAVAGRLNAVVTARPLGRLVPPSAAAAVGALAGAALARHAGLQETAAAAFGVGVGLAVGTVTSAKRKGGLLDRDSG